MLDLCLAKIHMNLVIERLR